MPQAIDEARVGDGNREPERSQQQKPHTITWIEKFIPAVSALSLFGGQITFTVIPSTLDQPDSRFSKQEVRNYLALAWLFFVLALGTASAAELFLHMHSGDIRLSIPIRPPLSLASKETNKISVLGGIFALTSWVFQFGDWVIVWMFHADLVSLLLQVFVLLAFISLSAVVFAYAPAIGAVALGFTGLGTFVAFVGWSVHTMLRIRTSESNYGTFRKHTADVVPTEDTNLAVTNLTRPGSPNIIQTLTVQTQVVQNQIIQTKPAQDQPAQNQPVHNQPVQNHPVQNPPAQPDANSNAS